MRKYIKKYKKIVGELVDKSFPSLKNKKIFVFEFWLGKFSGGVFWPLPNIRIIVVDPRVRKDNKDYVTALFAHELSHLDIFEKRSWIRFFYLYIKYWLSPKFRKETEYKVDKQAIRKGYAEQSYKRRKKHWKLGVKHKLDRYYMSPEEIRSYAKSIKRW